MKIFLFKIPAYDILLAVFKWPVRAYEFDYFRHQCQTVSFRGSVLKPGLIGFSMGRLHHKFLDEFTLALVQVVL